jgi:hypothetical protein
MDVQQREENGITYRVGQTVRRVDWESDGTPPYPGTLVRIELDDDEVTYWILWEGATASDPHGAYAFQSEERALRRRDVDMGDGITLREHLGGPGRTPDLWDVFYGGAFQDRYKTRAGALRRIERLKNTD